MVGKEKICPEAKGRKHGGKDIAIPLGLEKDGGCRGGGGRDFGLYRYGQRRGHRHGDGHGPGAGEGLHLLDGACHHSRGRRGHGPFRGRRLGPCGGRLAHGLHRRALPGHRGDALGLVLLVGLLVLRAAQGGRKRRGRGPAGEADRPWVPGYGGHGLLRLRDGGGGQGLPARRGPVRGRRRRQRDALCAGGGQDRLVHVVLLLGRAARGREQPGLRAAADADRPWIPFDGGHGLLRLRDRERGQGLPGGRGPDRGRRRRRKDLLRPGGEERLRRLERVLVLRRAAAGR